MLKKAMLAFVAVTSLGVSATTFSAPAKADEVIVEHRRDWRDHDRRDWHRDRHCRIVVRDVVIWHHGERRVVQRETRICD